MKHNMLRLDMNDIVRRKTSASLVKFSTNLPKELRNLLPEYTVILPKGFPGSNVRHLATLSTKHKGKCRIYSDVSDCHNHIHLYYVSRKDLIKLAKASSQEKAFSVLDAGLSNRWCLTIGRPVSACRSIGEWVHTLLCVENCRSGANRPPTGTTERSSVWRLGPYADEHFRIDPTNNCDLRIIIERRCA